MPTYTLISHVLCPYVQRVAIVLAEKSLAFERIDIDLANKPQWFLDLSPLGKTPLLLADGQPIFESAAICEYLDDTAAPRMHPLEPLERARQRAWIEHASASLSAIAALYSAPDEQAFEQKRADLRQRLAVLENAAPARGGHGMTLLDAAVAPLFRYFDVLERVPGLDFFSALPALARWRATLGTRASVRGAVRADHAARLRAFLLAKDSALARRMRAHTAVTMSACAPS